MKFKRFLTILAAIFTVALVKAQSSFPQPVMNSPKDGGILRGLNMNEMETSFVLSVNKLDEKKKAKLNQVASNYRSKNRSITTDIGKSMLAGGVASIVNVIATEIINLTQIRSKQRKAWQEMRNKECSFIDSLQSVNGQSDFYGRQSNYGPLDPSDMNFDGFTFLANREGKEVLRMVCHIDTTRFDHLFLHSKFYLVVDSIVFHPYRSFLPNLKANRIIEPRKGASKDERDYWETIRQFSFAEQKEPSINIRMDVFSSWINELVQVFQNVKLGSFSVNIPIKEHDLRDSVYVYCRKEALSMNKPTIDMEGECFVIPRSYMPVSANSPSWGTGEYKMKVVLSEKCRYNPTEGRSKHWHRDYKQLVRMQNNGKAKNEYLSDVITTFRDNKNTILKATYTPALTQMTGLMGLSNSPSMGGAPTAPTGASKPGAAQPGAAQPAAGEEKH